MDLLELLGDVDALGGAWKPVNSDPGRRDELSFGRMYVADKYVVRILKNRKEFSERCIPRADASSN